MSTVINHRHIMWSVRGIMRYRKSSCVQTIGSPSLPFFYSRFFCRDQWINLIYALTLFLEVSLSFGINISGFA